MTGRLGVIVAGRGQDDPDAVIELAQTLAWPVICDHRSGCRRAGESVVIDRFDSLLRDESFVDRHLPEVVLRFGEIVSSKAVSQYLSLAATSGAEIISGRPKGQTIDPEAIATITCDQAGLASAVLRAAQSPSLSRAPTASGWIDSWSRADRAAEERIAEVLASRNDLCEVHIARLVVETAPTGSALVLASSMPVRDVEWFGPARDDIGVYSNRGANGIDGTIATAIGIAATGTPTTCLIGDIAFLHDSTSLIGLAQRQLDLTIVVIDNDGGGIFSFLPHRELIETATYELLFGTPHGTSLARLVEAHRLTAHNWLTHDDPQELLGPAGVRVVIARSDRAKNLEIHNMLNDSVANGL